MKTGSSRICFARRIDMTASGTSFLCVWSNKPMFLIANSWGITGLTPEQEKILVLWLNSSINIFSILMERSETRGSFGQIDERQLLYFPIVDVFNMNKDEIDRGVILFDNIANEHFPSIFEQLVVSYHHRRSIDGYFLKILGITDQEERKEIIKSIHHTLANMMNSLKEMMSND
jgi:hypothetical protein